MTEVKQSVAAYGGWERCLFLANGQVELVVTLDVGPRVVRFGFAGSRNEFAEFPEEMGRRGDADWRVYGGHRLWCAPEDPAVTYYPDNLPVAAELTPQGARVTAPPETGSGLQKSLTFTLARDRAAVEVVHRIANTGPAVRDLAPWAISVMAPGGAALLPHPPMVPHPEAVLPNRALVLWPYTDMADPRAAWGARLTRVRQDSRRPEPFKVGLMLTAGWAAYQSGPHVFLKQFRFHAGQPYPDLGASAEVFTNDRMLELETLGPLTRLAPGDAVAHTEVWSLHRADLPEDDDGTLAALAALTRNLRDSQRIPYSGISRKGAHPG